MPDIPQKLVVNVSEGTEAYEVLIGDELLAHHQKLSTPPPSHVAEVMEARRKDMRIVTKGMSEEQADAMRRLLGAPKEE